MWNCMRNSICAYRKIMYIYVYVQGRSGIQAIPVWTGPFQDCPGRCGIAGPFRDGIYITPGICNITS